MLAPASPLLTGVHHLLIVPDGALQSLPLGVLVTKPPPSDPDSLGAHRNIAWLAGQYAITVLTDVSSLRVSLPRQAAVIASTRSLSVGGPESCERTSGIRLANVGALKNIQTEERFSVLTETLKELRSIGNPLGASAHDILRGAQASELILGHTPLENYGIIEFAAPLLITGEPKGTEQPALVLAQSAAVQPDNGELLTASRIAALKLNADWVVLSTCSTTVAGPPSA
jgi:CHAT domain-containing protein